MCNKKNIRVQQEKTYVNICQKSWKIRDHKHYMNQDFFFIYQLLMLCKVLKLFSTWVPVFGRHARNVLTTFTILVSRATLVHQSVLILLMEFHVGNSTIK